MTTFTNTVFSKDLVLLVMVLLATCRTQIVGFRSEISTKPVGTK